MSKLYISLDTILNAIQSLKNTSLKNSTIFRDFLILKFINVNKNEWTYYDDTFKDKSVIATKYLMSLFGPGERLPEKYELIDPLDFTWHTQSLSEGSEKFGRFRLWNNVVGGSQNWRIIVDNRNENDRERSIRFKYDYINKIKELCQMYTEKVSLPSIASWVFRFSGIDVSDSKKGTDVLLKSFLRLFNFSDDERKNFFVNNGESIHFNDKPVDPSLVRKEIGDPPSPYTFQSSTNKFPIEKGIILTEGVIRMESKNPSVDEIYEALKKAKQVILYGPPGTSKTYYAEEIAKKYFRERSMFLQLHQNYSYEDFIGGTKFVDGKPGYEKGVFVNAIDEANKIKVGGGAYLVILDEINRSNLSSIFGELFVALDRNYNNVIIGSIKSKAITLPENLYIIGTMNSSDRSIALIDFALRRRFKFVYLTPDEDLLLQLTDDSGLDGIKIVNLLDKINKGILEVLQNKELTFGHTFFMPRRLFNSSNQVQWSWPELEFEFNYSILPILEEYCFGNKSALTEIIGEELPKRLKGEDFITSIKEYLK